ncbi:cytochrome c oxidase subunit 7B, mitochondrial-like [Lissotriton helveticus]
MPYSANREPGRFIICFLLQSSFPLPEVPNCHLARGIPRIAARPSHHKAGPDFHDKYGNAVLVSGLVFCVLMECDGITWNVSPVGRVTPKEWKDQ